MRVRARGCAGSPPLEAVGDAQAARDEVAALTVAAVASIRPLTMDVSHREGASEDDAAGADQDERLERAQDDGYLLDHLRDHGTLW